MKLYVVIILITLKLQFELVTRISNNFVKYDGRITLPKYLSFEKDYSNIILMSPTQSSSSPPSTEEKDQISRSNKKYKRKITNWIFETNGDNDTQMVDSQLRDAISPPIQPLLQGQPNTPSFRDMLNVRNHSNPVQLQPAAALDEDDTSDDDNAPEEYLNNEQCPAILLTKEEKSAMRKPWKQALIIKMFHGKIGYMGLMRKLRRKWSLKGDLTLTDIGFQFYIARFTNEDDYQHVLTQGPWMIDDNYLTIRKWVPNFIPDDNPPKILTAWVRIPNLAVEYFDSTFLSKIGSKIGKILRIDKTTAQAVRGQFTRISVEIDLTKPLLAKFWLKGRIWRIQYEGLHMICFQCGCWGHNSTECQNRLDLHQGTPHQSHELEMEAEEVSTDHPTTHISPELESNFGDWMMVKKVVRKRQSRAEILPLKGAPPKTFAGGLSKPPAGESAMRSNLNSNLPPSVVQQPFEFQAPGSRFAALDAQIQEDLVEGNKKIEEQNIISSNADSFIPGIINLGDKSQPFSKNQPPLPAVQLEEIQKVTQEDLHSSNKSISIPEKKKKTLKPTRSTVLSVAKISKPKNAITKPAYKPPTGKENIDSNSQIRNILDHHDQLRSMPHQPVHIPLESSSTSCHPSPFSAGEDALCRTGNGIPLPDHGEPPGPSIGGGISDLEGTPPGAPGVGGHALSSQ